MNVNGVRNAKQQSRERVMSRLFWRLKYTLRVSERCGVKMFRFGWYCSGEALNDCCSVDENPIDAADDEMSYWND